MRIYDRAAASERPPQRSFQWEYRQTVADHDADLTQFGQDGWELVSVVPLPNDPTTAIFYFKRRRRF